MTTFIFLTAGLTLGIGYIGNKITNKKILNLSNPIEDFLLVSLSGFIANEITRYSFAEKLTGAKLMTEIPAKKLKYPFTKPPDIKPAYPKLNKAYSITNTSSHKKDLP